MHWCIEIPRNGTDRRDLRGHLILYHYYSFVFFVADIICLLIVVFFLPGDMYHMDIEERKIMYVTKAHLNGIT